jgi:hypothetical protein
MPKMTTTATVTTTAKITLAPRVKRQLLTDLRAIAELKEQKKAIELALKKHTESVEGAREEIGEKTFALEGFTVTRVEGTTSSLDKMKFVSLGGSLSMLEEATVTKPKAAYTLVTPPGSKEE